jgi:putative ABC transport system permease protein
MLHNYVLAALRSLRNQKLFAVINIVGLSVGLAACTLIILFVQHEFSYDNQFSNQDLLYRIESTPHIPGQPSNDSPNFFGTAYDLLPGDYEEIEAVTRLQQRDGTVIKGANAILEEFVYTDPEFLSMFDFPLIEGDRATALDSPDAMVLTEEMAIKHLGEGPWLGKTLRINHVLEREHKVTGVLQNIPGNTHFDFSILLPIDRRIYEAEADGGTTDLERWNGLPFYVYIQLKEGRGIENLRATINDWVDKYFPEQIRALVGVNGSEVFTPRIIPVRDIHMYSPVDFDMKPPGSLATIYSFGGIALMILVIACINFMNLATARATLRGKEVALRKVMGASRRQLFVQFEFESLVSTLFALVFALALLEFILPQFSNYTERVIESSALFDPVVMVLVACLTLVVGLLAGLHPALVLSGLRPAKILTSSRNGAGGKSTLRAALVLFQFTISAALVIMTILIYVQTDYARSIDLGYDNANVLTVRGVSPVQMGDATETVAREIAATPGVTGVSLSSFAPGDGLNSGLSLRVPGIDDRVIIFYRAVYPAFFEQFDVKPIAGRLLSEERAGDRTVMNNDPNSLEHKDVNVVINESAVKMLNFGTPEEALGKVYYRGRENQIVSTVVGVIPDIHFGSPRGTLDPEIYMYIPADVSNLIVSYRPAEFKSVSNAIEARMLEMFPRLQNQVQHLQDNIAEQYREEEIQATLLGSFSGLAILIACMGLFGLASFTIVRRTKEIGVRKVMGASPLAIVILLVMQFSRPVLIANVLAWPICWYAVSEWLAGFEFRIELLPWFIFVSCLAALITMMLAWGTVAGHALMVARTSPVFALRYE